MIKIYHLEDSRSFRLIWLLEELNLKYELIEFKRNNDGLAGKKLLSKHPIAKAPMLEDNNKILLESGAIFEYILNKYDKENKLNYTKKNIQEFKFWLHAGEGSIMPLIVIRVLFEKIVENSPFFIKPISKIIKSKIDKSYLDQNLENYFDYIEKTLKKNKWFIGNKISAIDIFMSFIIEKAILKKVVNKKNIKTFEFNERIKQMKSYKRVEEKIKYR